MAAVVKYPGLPITLGGVEYIIPPLPINASIQYEEFISKTLDGTTSENPLGDWKLMTEIIHAAISRNYPEITLEQVRSECDVGNIYDIYTLVMDVMGLQRKALGSGAGERKPRRK